MQAIISAIAKPMGLLLSFIYGFIGNYGVTIILFTVLIKLILYPLTIHQLKQTKKMSELQPKIQELQKKYKNDKEKLNIKIMELYKEENVNPAGGCLPLLIQMPIILGLFSLLRNPTQYMNDPVMLAAVKESFLWMSDLSQPDKWILPILAGITTYFTMSSSTSGQPGNNQTLKTMQYVFPVLIVWWGRSFPAGLTLYWFISNAFQYVQQLITKSKPSSKEE